MRKVTLIESKTLLFAVLGILIVSLSGCATTSGYSSKFTATKKVNLAPFADQTIAMISEADFGLTEDESVLTRKYWDRNSPEFKELNAIYDDIGAILDRIMNYSTGIVTVSESKRPLSEKINLYADYVDKMGRPRIEKLDITPAELNETLEHIRKQQKLLDALNAAQPLINTAVRNAMAKLRKAENVLLNASISIEQAIEADFVYELSFEKELKIRKVAVLQALEAIFDHLAGDAEALKRLANNPMNKSKNKILNKPVSDDDLHAIEQYLIDRLVIIQKLEDRIAHDMQKYEAAHRELDRLYTAALKDMSKVKLMLIVWSSAHQKMSAGVEDPAEWFDINNAPAALFRVGEKLLF
jgi:hypothetical protein